MQLQLQVIPQSVDNFWGHHSITQYLKKLLRFKRER